VQNFSLEAVQSGAYHAESAGGNGLAAVPAVPAVQRSSRCRSTPRARWRRIHEELRSAERCVGELIQRLTFDLRGS
jgi:hypothetical protein